MRKWMITLALFASSALFAYPPLPKARSEEELLLVRRIIDFWRDKEYAFAQAQIKSYLKSNPDSPYQDHFLAMLGDMAMQNQRFDEAYDLYTKIKGEPLKEHAELKKWQALYHLKRYFELYQEMVPHTARLNEEGIFYLAEATFREALTLVFHPEGKSVALSLFEEALPLYNSLIESPLYRPHAKLGLAEIYRWLEQPEKSATLYLEISEEENNSEILFHAARLLLQCDKNRAKAIFQKLAHEPFAKAEEAAYHWLLLLAEAKEWEVIEQKREFFTNHLSQEHLPFCFFYLGMLQFEKKNYEKSAEDLQRCCFAKLPETYEKKVWLTLISAAIEVEKWELAESCFETLAPRIEEWVSQAGYILASGYQKKGHSFRALKIYERVITDFPNSSFAEAAFCEKIFLLASQEKYEEAHVCLLKFLNQFPETPKRLEMIRLASDLKIAQATHQSDYETLAADLEWGLQEGAFHAEELKERQALLAKTYLKLGNTKEAKKILLEMENPDSLLLAYCYIEEGEDIEKIIEFGELALSEHPDEHSLHLPLFNAYVTLAQNHSEKEHKRDAARHLEAATSHYPISLENKIWLAHFFYKECSEKALPLFESILTGNGERELEEEALLLASLYIERNQLEKAEALLMKGFVSPERGETATLKLAEIHSLRGESERAAHLYQQLENSSLPKIGYAAQLSLARLYFPKSPQESLERLEMLYLKKMFATEPLHFEAALDFADFKASLCPAQERVALHLNLLLEIKAAYNEPDESYYAQRELFPEKELVYLAYMRYLDARIYLLQAHLSNDPVDGKTKINAARALMSTLRHGKYAVSHYIKEKAAINYYDN